MKFLGNIIVLYRQLQRQRRYLKIHLPDLLSEIFFGDSLSFFQPHYKRITAYAQIAITFTFDPLCQLTGRPLNANEHKRIILLSAFGPLFDDLFDDRLLNPEHIELLITRPTAYVPLNITDHVVKQLYLSLLQIAPRRQQFINHQHALFYWQKASLKQLDPTITEEELLQVTYNKSYYAILLYCTLLDHYPNEEILAMLYPVAGLLQLTNDAFDVWKDIHNKVYTLPNLIRDIGKLQQRFMDDVALINKKLWQLPYPVRLKQMYATTVHLLLATGWMALEHQKSVTAGVTTVDALAAMPRKALICDMDTLPQKVKCLRHIYRLVKYQKV